MVEKSMVYGYPPKKCMVDIKDQSEFARKQKICGLSYSSEVHPGYLPQEVSVLILFPHPSCSCEISQAHQELH